MKILAIIIALTGMALANPAKAQQVDPQQSSAVVSPATAQASTSQLSPSATTAIATQRAEQVVAMFNAELEDPPEEVFSSAFLNAISPAQLSALFEQWTSEFGKAVAVETLDQQAPGRFKLEIRMERAIAKGTLVVNSKDEGRIVGLRFTAFEPINDSVKKIEADLAALPGTVSAYFGPIANGDPVISIVPERQMALGSTFKLYVLAALAQDIAQGKRRWDDVVTLDTKSFPSGMMQDWPDNAPVTLHTLASLMISISDNTATDQLMHLLGPERLRKVLIDSGHSRPDLNDPFLTTRDLFLLKGGARDRLKTYAQSSPAVRAQILEGIESETVSLEQIEAAFSEGPIALDVEWFASTRDLASLMAFINRNTNVTTLQIMAINKNATQTARENWRYVGYKGGSEPGVLNLTWLLTDQDDQIHMLSLAWNNPDANLDESALELISQRILSLPR